MTNLELTKWLAKVRDALAEQDEGKRDSMLRAADRFLKGSNQSRVFRRTRIGECGGQLVQSKQVVEPRGQRN